MKQVVQNLKTGVLSVDNVPSPILSEGQILIQNKFSLISAGTEKSTISTAQASLLGKAMKRPDLVKQVLENIQKEGLANTFSKVQNKLDTSKPLGYSSAGIVLETGVENSGFKPGDFVACGGANYASHAEVVSVPRNLVVRIPDGVSFEEACFTTLGAIALQGVRQADPKIGERVLVIGLGLLGQLTCQILKANGCKVMGIDLSDRLIELTNSSNTAFALNRNYENLKAVFSNFTDGFGFDSTIITAAAPNNDPIVLSTEVLRKKGRIVVVGAVKLDVPRDPDFYQKELELKISCSYGPGRYDVNYEELGQDYPIGYVRWTEKRNMQAFLELVANGSVKVKHLISHNYAIEDAEQAYDIVTGKIQEPYTGVLLKYNSDIKQIFKTVKVNANPNKEINVGFIGIGSFAGSYLIGPLKKQASLDSVCNSTGVSSKNAALKYRRHLLPS